MSASKLPTTSSRRQSRLQQPRAYYTSTPLNTKAKSNAQTLCSSPQSTPICEDSTCSRDFNIKSRYFGKSFGLNFSKLSFNSIVQNQKIQELRARFSDIGSKTESISAYKTNQDVVGESCSQSLHHDVQRNAEPLNGSSEVSILKQRVSLPANHPQEVIWGECERSSNAYESTRQKETYFQKVCLNERSHLKLEKLSKKSPFSSFENVNNHVIDDPSLDDSLGILTPDQMDDVLGNPFSPSEECLPRFVTSDTNSCLKSPEVNDSPITENSITSPYQTSASQQNQAIIEHQDNDFEKYTENGIFSSNQVLCENTLIERPKHSLSLMNLNWSKSSFKNLEELKTDEDFLNSVHNSFLEPVSSTVETTINLELPDEKKNIEILQQISIHRIESTPSPEDLPLDPISSCIVDQATCSNCTNIQTVTSSSDCTKSTEVSKVSNSFITSITSVTSLDGYQGDDESRPVSRGADHSPLLGLREENLDWQNVPRRVNDVMTDSDYITESDMDGHEDPNKGHRIAQVIDGALYGQKSGAAVVVENRNDDSCMESSGFYTDIDTNRLSPVFLNALDESNQLPEGSSPSSQSICSQNNETVIQKNIKSQLTQKCSPEKEGSTKLVRESPDKRYKTHGNGPKEQSKFLLKKHKMPNKDVPSKVKATIHTYRKEESSKTDPKKCNKTQSNRQLSNKTCPRFTYDNKNCSYKNIKSKVDSFALQRSQTSCGVPSMAKLESGRINNMKPKLKEPSHTSRQLKRGSSVVESSTLSSLHSSQSDVSASVTSKPQNKIHRVANNRTSKKREIAPLTVKSSRVSAPPPNSTQSQSPPAQTKANPIKKNGTLPKLTASPSALRARIPANNNNGYAVQSQLNNSINNNNGSPKAKIAPRRPIVAKQPIEKLKEPGRVQQQQTKSSSRPQQLVVKPKLPIASAEPSPALVHAKKGLQALGVLVQYLVFQLEALNAPHWRAEAAKWRCAAAEQKDLASQSARSYAQRTQRDLDTIAECLNKISLLEGELAVKEEENAQLLASKSENEEKYKRTLDDINKLKEENNELKKTIATLKCEAAENLAKLTSQVEKEAVYIDRVDCLEAELSGVKGETDSDFAHKNKEELVAEVKSLRAVLELKQAEAGALRIAKAELHDEVERREQLEKELEMAKYATEELKARSLTRHIEAEKLRDQNARLKEVAAREEAQKNKLLRTIEELQFKLKHKATVVQLLSDRNSRYHDRTFPVTRRSRTSSCESPSPPDTIEAASPSPIDRSPASARKEPAVKAIVEKHDSVSWVLEIEETPEETASRLAKRSDSFKKRRTISGSSSPCSSRTSQTTEVELVTPLKESAGEAIYIYDNRQF